LTMVPRSDDHGLMGTMPSRARVVLGQDAQVGARIAVARRAVVGRAPR
jgi:hypothetical protein